MFLPLIAVAGEGLPDLPERPSGRVADVNRNPSLPVDRRIYITYGGNVILKFPNYNVRTTNFRDGSIPGEAAPGGVSVTFHNEAGMWWNGEGLYLGPGYSYNLLTANRYARGVVGDPNVRWPTLAAEAPPSVTKRALEFPPLVGYRDIQDADVEGRMGPDHSPIPMPQIPLVSKPYLTPMKPILGLDGTIHYVPADTADGR